MLSLKAPDADHYEKRAARLEAELAHTRRVLAGTRGALTKLRRKVGR
jgi:hypothetical protein